ncbi:outer membrane porin, OmpA/MotB family [Candidatus Paraburkholderia kirkii]|nr:outer membrane porin, OmpA/MotB family [Candidatus Paraburkholderia kirkii]
MVCATMLGVLKRHLSQHNGGPDQLPALLGHQLPVVRTNMTDAFARALGLGSVGAFLAGVASRLKAVSAHLEHPVTQEAAEFPLQSETPAAGQPEEKENAYRKKWWWVALVAALALLGRGCSTTQSATSEQEAAPAAKPEAASGPVADMAASAPVEASAPVAAPAADSAMSFLVDASGVPTLTATVGSEAEKQRLIDVLAAKLGVDRFHADVSVDPDTKPAAWPGKLDELLPVMALPGAQVRVAGEQVDLGGRAADATLGWTDKLKAAFGDGWTITASGTATAQAPSGAGAAGACAAMKSQCPLRPTIVGAKPASRQALSTTSFSARLSP